MYPALPGRPPAVILPVASDRENDMNRARTICLFLAAAALQGCAGREGKAHVPTGTSEATMAGQVSREGHKVWIEGVDRYRVIDPLYEGVRIILAARGDVYSPDYIQGISGSAFRIGGICPCAPTCANWISPRDFIRLLGYDLERLKLEGKGDQLAANTQEVVARVRKEIDAGRAVLVWHAFTKAEFDVVFGYDTHRKEFLGRGSYAGNDKPYVRADEKRMSTCGHVCPPLGVILIGRRTGKLDARAAEVAALQEAVRHARWRPDPKKTAGEKWTMFNGIACYDRWVSDFRKNPKKPPNGSQYCYGVIHTTHRAAGGFLREIAPKYAKGGEHLKQAAGRFEKEAEILDSGQDVLWWKAPKELTKAHCRKAADLLQRARDEYVAGIALIEKALTAEGAAIPRD